MDNVDRVLERMYKNFNIFEKRFVESYYKKMDGIDEATKKTFSYENNLIDTKNRFAGQCLRTEIIKKFAIEFTSLNFDVFQEKTDDDFKSELYQMRSDFQHDNIPGKLDLIPKKISMSSINLDGNGDMEYYNKNGWTIVHVSLDYMKKPIHLPWKFECREENGKVRYDCYGLRIIRYDKDEKKNVRQHYELYKEKLPQISDLFDSKGYDLDGYNSDGYDENGYDCAGTNQFGIPKSIKFSENENRIKNLIRSSMREWLKKDGRKPVDSPLKRTLKTLFATVFLENPDVKSMDEEYEKLWNKLGINNAQKSFMKEYLKIAFRIALGVERIDEKYKVDIKETIEEACEIAKKGRNIDEQQKIHKRAEDLKKKYEIKMGAYNLGMPVGDDR